jgi:type VI secretion system protein VasG
MAKISRAAIFSKLNKTCYQSIQAAYNFCKLRQNPNVEIGHWIHQILELQDSDLHHIVRFFDLDLARLSADMIASMDTYPKGRTTQIDFSSRIEDLIERAWILASLHLKAGQIRSGALLAALVENRDLAPHLYQLSDQFKKIKSERLLDEFDSIVGQSSEEALTAVAGGASSDAATGGSQAPAGGNRAQALAAYTVDMTEEARAGKIDPIVGRDEEIRQIVDVLMRRKQNNPILTGEAGVGKTAVVEGFALRIARGDVPASLKNVSLRSLDVGLMLAGASMKGEFESRLRDVIEAVQSSEKPIILFIDEAHTLIGAGGAAGTGDAANLLKPALARGNLRTIAATTWAEYKKHIEKDPALTRRFQVVAVEEPGEEKAILMMRGVASTMERHHQVQILDEALEAAVRLSHRYIPSRQLPDKAVSLLDTVAARVAISQHAVPAEVDDLRKAIESLQTEQSIVEREESIGIDVKKRKQRVTGKLADEALKLTALEARWETEKGLVKQILDLRNRLRAGQGIIEGTGSRLESAAKLTAAGPAAGTSDPQATPSAALSSADSAPLSTEERHALLHQLKELQRTLQEVHGESPLILPTVDAQAVAAVVQDWSGIPVGRMVKNEIETVLNLPAILAKRIIGQDHGLRMIAKRIQTSRANLDNPNKPIGVFMLAGTSGVGKTETALALAEAMYGGEQNIITINMSEFQEAHTVSTLKGAPPGYVGYGEGGVLTEAVRRKPYSVVLLDEVEKAHPDVHEIFFQVFDKGVMEDGEGRVIDFKNTLILLTTNVGTDLIMSLCKDPDLMPEPEGIAQALRDPLLKVFPAALLGRLVVIPYYPLNDEMLREITKLQLARIQKRMLMNHEIELTYDADVLNLIVNRCTELDSGGRMIDSILTNTVLPEISNELLRESMSGQRISTIAISVKDEVFNYDFQKL